MDKFIADDCLEEIQMLNKFKKYIKSKNYINWQGIQDDIEEDLVRYRKSRKRALKNIKEEKNNE